MLVPSAVQSYGISNERKGERKILVVLRVCFPNVVSVHLRGETFRSHFSQFMGRFGIYRGRLGERVKPWIREQRGKGGPFYDTRDGASVLRLGNDVQIMVSPTSVRGVVNASSGVPKTIRTVRFLLHARPSAPFIVLRRTISKVKGRVIVCNVNVHLFPVQPGACGTFPIYDRPNVTK